MNLLRHFDGNMIKFRRTLIPVQLICSVSQKHAVFQLITYKYVSQQKTVHLNC